MAGLVELPRSRVSLLGVIVGGLLIGAGGFGLFRVTNANPGGDLPPLPSAPLPPLSEGRPDPVGLPLVIPAGVPVPPVLPPVLPPLAPDLPKPGEVLPPPAPLPPPPLPVLPPPSAPKPPELPPALPDPIGPKFPALPEPGGVKPPALPPKMPEVPPAPKPVAPVAPPAEITPLPKPAVPDLPIPPVNPDLNLRPPAPGHTVNSKPLPAEVSPAPRPAVTVLPTPAGPLDTPAAPGDPTVTLALRQTMLSAALGVGLALTPSPAFAQEKDKPADPPELKKQVEDLRKEVDALKKQNEVQADLILGRSDGKDVLPEDKGLMKRVKTLEEAIKRIEGKLDAALKGDTKQVVGSSPIGDPAKGSGTIRLINEYPTDVSIILNGTSHPLKANELKEVVIPAGEFAYELIATGATKTNSTIKDGERVTLRIR